MVSLYRVYILENIWIKYVILYQIAPDQLVVGELTFEVLLDNSFYNYKMAT